MSAGLGDFIRVTDKQILDGQTVLNVFFYRVVSITGITDGYLGSLAAWFDLHVTTAIQGVQHAAINHKEMFLENLTNGVDIYTYVYPGDRKGITTSGDVMPSFVTWGFQLMRENRNTRHGYKRFSGVGEVQVSNGQPDIGSTYTDTLATALALDWTEGVYTFAEPVILRHPITVPLVSPVYSSIGSARFKGLGTQNTRKSGRGV